MSLFVCIDDVFIHYVVMHIHEFEFRYQAYRGLAFHAGLERSQDTLFSLVHINEDVSAPNDIQKIQPDELKRLSYETYHHDKHAFLAQYGQLVILDAGLTLADYIHRLEYEMYVIKHMGFIPYMLVVADYVRAAREMKIVVGPGRGSGAGSVLARCLMITDVDPLQYGLLFERFLNPARVSMPDFDIDFEDALREKVIQYVTHKYGSDNVCAIGTYMQLARKAAFKDVARALGMSFERANYLTTLLPEKISIEEAIASTDDEYADLRSAYNHDELFVKTLSYSQRLEGNLRQLGVHACGYIIAPEPIVHYTALFDGGSKGMVSHADGHVLEALGLLKMDFLGLRNLSVIKNCCKIIKARKELYGADFFEKSNPMLAGFWSVLDHFFDTMLFHPPMNDPYVFDTVFKSGDTSGIFQFEGEGIKKFLVQLKPTDINDLFAMNALYRPGPLEFIPTYIRRKHGEEMISYMLPELRDELIALYGPECVEEENKKLTEDLSPIMDVTYGIAVYQEQLMVLVQRMAGFSLADADTLRRGVGKKIKELIEKLKGEFVQKATNFRHYKPETARVIYEKMIEPAASYSFNKSHSVCYALIAYQTAYLKAYFPLEFYASLLRSIEEDTEKLGQFINEVVDHGIEVRRPCVNASFCHIAAVDAHVQLGFLCIKGIGLTIAEGLEQERRTNGIFSSVSDFLRRCKPWINKKSLEGLVYAGALDTFFDRQTLIDNLQSMLDFASRDHDDGGGLFGEVTQQTCSIVPSSTPLSQRDYGMMEYMMFKAFVSYHPFNYCYPLLKKYNFLQQVLAESFSGAFVIHVIVIGIQRAKKKGFFVQIEDITARHELFFKTKMDFTVGSVRKMRGFKRGKYLSFETLTVLDYDVRRQENKTKWSQDFPVWAIKKMR